MKTLLFNAKTKKDIFLLSTIHSSSEEFPLQAPNEATFLRKINDMSVSALARAMEHGNQSSMPRH